LETAIAETLSQKRLARLGDGLFPILTDNWSIF
jgi:hypothetical protein